MEIVFEKKTKIRPLNLAHFRQLHDYCMVAEEDGGYSGNEKHYWKRHNEIRAWVEDCIKTLEKK
jgi:hypothetical protein